MFTTKLNLVAPLAFAVLGVIAASIEPALAGVILFRLLSLVLAYPLWRFWPVDTGSFARFVSAVRAKSLYETMGELGMFATKLNLVAPLAVLVVVAASIESALAGPGTAVPAPSHWLLASPLWRFWPVDTGSFARFASAVRATAP